MIERGSDGSTIVSDLPLRFFWLDGLPLKARARHLIGLFCACLKPAPPDVSNNEDSNENGFTREEPVVPRAERRVSNENIKEQSNHQNHQIDNPVSRVVHYSSILIFFRKLDNMTKNRLHLRIVVPLLLLFHATAVRAFRSLRQGGNSMRPYRIRHGEESRRLRLCSLPSVSSTSLRAAMRFKNFEHVLETFREEPVIIYFSTNKCGPCKLMKKEVAVIKEMVGNELKMFSIDAEKWPQVGSRFKVSRLPCIVVFQEGEVKLRLEGVNSAETVVEQVRSLL